MSNQLKINLNFKTGLKFSLFISNEDIQRERWFSGDFHLNFSKHAQNVLNRTHPCSLHTGSSSSCPCRSISSTLEALTYTQVITLHKMQGKKSICLGEETFPMECVWWRRILVFLFRGIWGWGCRDGLNKNERRRRKKQGRRITRREEITLGRRWSQVKEERWGTIGENKMLLGC